MVSPVEHEQLRRSIAHKVDVGLGSVRWDDSIIRPPCTISWGTRTGSSAAGSAIAYAAGSSTGETPKNPSTPPEIEVAGKVGHRRLADDQRWLDGWIGTHTARFESASLTDPERQLSTGYGPGPSGSRSRPNCWAASP